VVSRNATADHFTETEINLMTDCIEIRDLMVRAIVGINDEERVNRQDVVINLTIWSDLRDSGRTDDIDDTFNYRTLAKLVIEMVEESSFFLVEKLGTEIALLSLEFSESIERIRVTVEKPGAIRFARSVGVTIERTRDDLVA